MSFCRAAFLRTLCMSSVKELVAIFKANPRQLGFDSTGVGSFAHFGGELLKSLACIVIVNVSNKGAAASMLGAIVGHTHALVVSSLPRNSRSLPSESGQVAQVATKLDNRNNRSDNA